MTALDPAVVSRMHDREAGITEALLRRAVDADGRTPYDWLAAAVPAGPGRLRVLDVGCGSAPLAAHLPGRGYVGLDLSAAELALARRRHAHLALVRADAGALPLVAGVDAVVSSMALMLLDPVGPVLAGLARLLPVGGWLVATLPALVEGGPDVLAQDAAVHRAALDQLGRHGIGYATTMAAPHAILAGAGLELRADTTTRFAVPVVTAADVDLLVRAYYAVDDSPAALARAAEAVVDLTAGTDQVGYAIRRLVARRVS